jgi:hypothetical protein
MAHSYVEQRKEEDRLFAKFCASRGLDPDVMRRPLMWWTIPREQWPLHWSEKEIPKNARASKPKSVKLAYNPGVEDEPHLTRAFGPTNIRTA